MIAARGNYLIAHRMIKATPLLVELAHAAVAFAVMERTMIDGVTVWWADSPGPLSAWLTFGVGARDESFRSIGITHMVEHLAMRTLPKLRHDHHASVDLEVTDFAATGRPDQIVDFLQGVCAALGDLPIARMPLEAGVLAAEGGQIVHPNVAALLRARYGARGAGLSYYSGPGIDRLTEHMVLQHAARFFVAGNAVLQLTGEPPPGLAMPLPRGPKPTHDLHEVFAQPGPLLIPGAAPGVGLMLRAERSAAWTVTAAVLRDRLTRQTRHERGLSYGIADGSLVGAAGQRDVYFAIDARRGQDTAAARVAWSELTRLAQDGPNKDELADEVASFRDRVADPRWPEAAVNIAAYCTLFDLEQRNDRQRLDEIMAVRPADITECLAAAIPTALMSVGDDAPLQIDDLSEGGGCQRGRNPPAGRTFAPSALARVFSKDARRARLILTGNGLAYVDSDAYVHTVAFHEVAGVLASDRLRLVFGANGCILPVDLDLFPSARPAIRAVDAAVPADLHFPASALDAVG